jgi:hypothetical protein
MLKISETKPRVIALENVVAAYNGHPTACRCGCSGKYFYTKGNQIEAGKRRGYDVGDDEVNDKQVARMLKVINEAIVNPSAVVEVILPTENKSETIYDFVVNPGKRTYTLYVK